MPNFHMNCMITVSAYTVVEADTLEEAIDIADGRECGLSFNGCGNYADEMWLVEEVDGEPKCIEGRIEA